MNLKFHSFLFSLAAITVLQAPCEGILEFARPISKKIYFTSFEFEEDLQDWVGIGTDNLRLDTPATGGKKSVYISGGSIISHASLILAPPGRDTYVYIQCYCKTLSNGGLVNLDVGKDLLTGIFIPIENTWAFYTSSDTLGSVSSNFASAKGPLGLVLHSFSTTPERYISLKRGFTEMV